MKTETPKYDLGLIGDLKEQLDKHYEEMCKLLELKQREYDQYRYRVMTTFDEYKRDMKKLLQLKDEQIKYLKKKLEDSLGEPDIEIFYRPDPSLINW